MDMDEIICQLTETVARSKSNTKRLDKIELQQEEIKSLATSTAVMAQRLGTVESTVGEIKTSVEEIKSKPVKRVDGIVDKLLWLVIGALAAWVLGSVGINV